MCVDGSLVGRETGAELRVLWEGFQVAVGGICSAVYVDSASANGFD